MSCTGRIVEAWFDREAVEYTGCDGGWDAYFTYWINEPGTVLDENFFVKVITEAEKAIGVMAVFREEDRYYIQEFVISPDRRGMGTGSSILKELLASIKLLKKRDSNTAMPIRMGTHGIMYTQNRDCSVRSVPTVSPVPGVEFGSV